MVPTMGCKSLRPNLDEGYITALNCPFTHHTKRSEIKDRLTGLSDPKIHTTGVCQAHPAFFPCVWPCASTSEELQFFHTAVKKGDTLHLKIHYRFKQIGPDFVFLKTPVSHVWICINVISFFHAWVHCKSNTLEEKLLWLLSGCSLGRYYQIPFTHVCKLSSNPAVVKLVTLTSEKSITWWSGHDTLYLLDWFEWSWTGNRSLSLIPDILIHTQRLKAICSTAEILTAKLLYKGFMKLVLPSFEERDL